MTLDAELIIRPPIAPAKGFTSSDRRVHCPTIAKKRKPTEAQETE